MLGLVLAIAGQASAALSALPLQVVDASIEPGVEYHRTVAGVTIEMPELAALDCDGIRQVLRNLDRSNYRGLGVLEVGHPDHPVFVYEDALARAHFFDCILRAYPQAGAETVLLRGFGAD
ncbi:MAG: hypothetical protein AAGC57_03340 [Pseudomonadota bacterium]